MSGFLLGHISESMVISVPVGTTIREVGSGALHHNGKFDVDEKCMTLGAMATVQFAADFLNE